MKPSNIRVAITAALALQTTAALAVVFTNSNTIGVANTTYDGLDVVVSGCVLTINGPHSFASLVVTNTGAVAHSPAPSGEAENRLDLTVAGDVTVGADSRIDVNYLGYGSDAGPGVGGPGAGGGYGGRGSGGGAVYGSIVEPNAFGSGGGYANGYGGAGGGVVRLTVGGSLQVDVPNLKQSIFCQRHRASVRGGFQSGLAASTGAFA